MRLLSRRLAASLAVLCASSYPALADSSAPLINATTWTDIAAAGATYEVQNTSSVPLYLTTSASVPSSASAGTVLLPSERICRTVATGDLYARGSGGVVVTTGLTCGGGSSGGASGSTTTTYNSTSPTLTNGQTAPLQSDSSGNLKVTGSFTTVGGTASNGSDAQATSATNSQNVVFNYVFNGSTWDRARGSISGGMLAQVTNFPATQAVSAAALPLPSGAATAANQNTTAAGTSAANAQGVQGVTGGVAMPVSGAFFQATQPVSGTFFQTTQPVSAAALPLPTGAATGVASASTTAGQSGTLAMGATTSSVPSYTTAQTNPLSLTTSGALRSDLTTINGFSSNTGAGSSASGTLRVITSSDSQIAGQVTQFTGGVALFSRLVSAAATTNATLVKSSMGRIYKVFGCNTTTSAIYMHFTNAAAAPTPGTTAVTQSRVFPPSGTAGVPACASYDMSDIGFYYATGIGYWLSGAGADTDTTALAAGAITQLELAYQ